MKEEEKRRTSIIIFLCVHVGIVYVLCVNWNNLMLCVILCIIVCVSLCVRYFGAFDVALYMCTCVAVGTFISPATHASVQFSHA